MFFKVIFSNALVFLLLTAAFPALAFAAGPYRCNGKVQHRPCNTKMHLYNRNVYTPAGPFRPLRGALYRRYQPVLPKIVRASFKALPERLGLWYGYVRGRGEVGLRLEILKNNKLVTTRDMGSVTLKKLKTVTFRYKATLPQLNGWKWRIRAFPVL